MISVRIISLYWSQLSFVVFAFKTETLGPELQVSMGRRPHQCFLCIHNSDFSTRIASHHGSQLSSVVLCIHKSDIMTRINNLYGFQTSPVVLCIQNSVISHRITTLDESLTSPVVLTMQNNVISIRITSLYGSQPSSVVFAWKTATFGSELQVSMGPRHRLLICEC